MNTPWLSAAALADAPHVTLANRGSLSISEKKERCGWSTDHHAAPRGGNVTDYYLNCQAHQAAAVVSPTPYAAFLEVLDAVLATVFVSFVG